VIEVTVVKHSHFRAFKLLVLLEIKINQEKKKALVSKNGKMEVHIREPLPKAKAQDGAYFIMPMGIYSKANLKKE
jgi:hypothetical protein